MATINIKGYEVLIDDEDVSRVIALTWHVARIKGKPTGVRHSTSKKTKPILLHRFLLGSVNPEIFVDHKNGNVFDNRKENLRECSRSQNVRNQKRRVDNKSGFKGVFFSKRLGRWLALISYENIKHHLGVFDTPELAYKAYCEAAKKYHGEFARFE